LFLDLFSISSSSLKQWSYGALLNDHTFTRDKYVDLFMNIRIKKIQNLINKYKPQLVVFLGNNKRTNLIWTKIVDINLNDWIVENKWQYFKTDNITYSILPHSVAHVTKNFFENTGEKLRVIVGNK
jgi:hypothetical protein